MKHKTILITGGLGFIGTNVIRRLLANTPDDILIFDKITYAGRVDNLPQDKKTRSRIHFYKGDITKKRSVFAAVKEADIVVHLAADTHTFRSLTYAVPTVLTNVLGTALLLEASRKHPVERFIQISSSEVYGNSLPDVEMDENHPLNPVSPYAASKLAADRLAYSFYQSQGVPTTVLRFFNAYGPYQFPEKMVPLFITRLLKKQPISLNHGGRQVRDWVFVEDHAKAIETIITSPADLVVGEVFNIGTGTATSIREVAELICRQLNLGNEYIRIAESSKVETMGNVGISRKVKQKLGWGPQTSLTEGLNRTIDWYKENQSWWDR